MYDLTSGLSLLGLPKCSADGLANPLPTLLTSSPLMLILVARMLKRIASGRNAYIFLEPISKFCILGV
jgi:hypothetical protein